VVCGPTPVIGWLCIADDSEDEDDARTQWALIWNLPEGEPPEGGYKLILILCPL